MFKTQIQAWKNKLESLEVDDPERDRIEKHLERLTAHAELAALSQRDDIGVQGRPANPDNFKGRTFVQALKSRAVATLDGITLDQAARQIYGKSLGPTIVKAADPITTADSAGVIGPAAQDFIEILREASVYDSLPLRRVRAHLPVTRVLEGSLGYWVAEGAKIAASKWGAERFALDPLKVGALVPATLESVRDSSPSSDRLIMQDITYALGTTIDEVFASADAVTTGTPAGILHGVTPISTSGDEVGDVVSDIKGLINAMPRTLRNRAELLMGPELALDIATFRTDLNERAFPGMTLNGGTLEGLPVRVSSGVPAGVLIALIPDEIYAIHDVAVELAISRDASIDGTSLFEHALVGFRGLRSVNWDRRRDGVVQYIATASYGPAASGT